MAMPFLAGEYLFIWTIVTEALCIQKDARHPKFGYRALTVKLGETFLNTYDSPAKWSNLPRRAQGAQRFTLDALAIFPFFAVK